MAVAVAAVLATVGGPVAAASPPPLASGWVVVQIPAPGCALRQVSALLGPASAETLAGLFAPTATGDGAGGDGVRAGSKGSLGLDLRSPVELAFSWYPRQRVIAARVTEPAETARRLTLQMDEDAVATDHGDYTLYPLADSFAALSGRDLALSSSPQLLPAGMDVARRLAMTTTECESNGDGITAPLGRLWLDLGGARQTLAPLMRRLAFGDIRRAPPDPPLPRRALALARLLEEAPSVRVALAVAAAAGGLELSTPPALASRLSVPASRDGHIRITGAGPLLDGALDGMAILALGLDLPLPLADALHGWRRANPGPAHGPLEVVIERRSEAWHVAAHPLSEQGATISQVTVELPGHALRMSGEPGRFSLSILCSAEALARWLALVDESGGDLAGLFPDLAVSH